MFIHHLELKKGLVATTSAMNLSSRLTLSMKNNIWWLVLRRHSSRDMLRLRKESTMKNVIWRTLLLR